MAPDLFEKLISLPNVAACVQLDRCSVCLATEVGPIDVDTNVPIPRYLHLQRNVRQLCAGAKLDLESGNVVGIEIHGVEEEKLRMPGVLPVANVARWYEYHAWRELIRKEIRRLVPEEAERARTVLASKVVND